MMGSLRNAKCYIKEDGSKVWIIPNAKDKGNINDIRSKIFQRDNYKCFYCGSTNELHLDHVLPKSKFNIHCVYNLITSCRRCNFKKNSFLLSEDKLIEVKKYLEKANDIFSTIEIKEYRKRLERFYKKRSDDEIIKDILKR